MGKESLIEYLFVKSRVSMVWTLKSKILIGSFISSLQAESGLDKKMFLWVLNHWPISAMGYFWIIFQIGSDQNRVGTS